MSILHNVVFTVSVVLENTATRCGAYGYGHKSDNVIEPVRVNTTNIPIILRPFIFVSGMRFIKVNNEHEKTKGYPSPVQLPNSCGFSNHNPNRHFFSHLHYFITDAAHEEFLYTRKSSSPYGNGAIATFLGLFNDGLGPTRHFSHGLRSN